MQCFAVTHARPLAPRHSWTTRRSSISALPAAAEAGQAVGPRPAAPASAVDANVPFTQRDWNNFTAGYASQPVERSYFIDDSMVVEGAIPADLEGTLLRNGPALFEVGGKRIPQPFDGDGAVAMFAFKDGKAFFANRFVRTTGFIEEQLAGKLIYRGAFSKGNPTGGWFWNPFDFSVKGVANTGVIRWAGKLLSLWERDLPWELSTPDLETVGRTVQVPSSSPYFAAHYRVTQEADGSRRLVAFNADEAGRDNKVCVWEYPEGSLEPLCSTQATLPGAAFGFFHDFAVTEHYYVFLENPIELDYSKLLLEYMFAKACIAECLKYNPSRPAKLHLIPRPGRAAYKGPGQGHLILETSPFFSFHHANAFEAADGRVVVDTVALHEGMDFSASLDSGAGYYDDDVGRGTLTRLVADPLAGTVVQHRLAERACEFPCVEPSRVGRAHSHMWMVGARQGIKEEWGAPQVISKVSLPPEAGLAGPMQAAGSAGSPVQEQVYYPGREEFCQEPIFVPRTGAQAEDDGYIAVLVYEAGAHRTRLDLLDAATLDRVCAIRLPHHLAAGLHGSWSSEYLGADPASAASYQPTEYNPISSSPLRYE